MILSILLLFFGALISLAVGKKLQHRTGLILALLPISLFLQYLQKIDGLAAGASTESYNSLGETLGLRHIFILDGLSLLFFLLVCGIGTLILIYSHGYMRGDNRLGRFYALMMFFMASMAGLVLSGDLLSIYIFWELTSISSFLLIGTNSHKEEARASAAQALLITTFGGLAMLAGFVIISSIGGSFELAELTKHSVEIRGHVLYLPALVLVLLGVFTKSAQFPFHFWLPRAMVAPTPVSAYLHSAAMVNAGIFLLARIHPFMGDTTIWRYTISSVGALTLLVGAYSAVTQTDLKKILAYTTVSSLGMLTLLLGIGTKLAVEAALLYLVVHALYKASMFMIAGTIDEEAGSRDIYLLGNLKQRMPLTTLIAMLVLLSMAGLPPMLGYVSKEMIYEAQMQVPGVAAHIVVTGILGNMFMLLISLIIAYNVFLRRERYLPQKPTEPGLSFMLGPAILAVLSFGLVPFSDAFATLIEHGVEAAKVRDIEVHIALWKGLKPAFWLSLITIFGGLAMFRQRHRLLPLFERINAGLIHFHLTSAFSRMITLLLRGAEIMTRSIQHGYHRIYLLSFFIISSVALWFQLIRFVDFGNIVPITEISASVAGAAFFALCASIIAMFTRSKLTAIVSMGVVGYVIALIFVVNGAVDLAVTQFLVDTLITVLFVFAAYKLPEFEDHSPKAVMIRDVAISISVGGVMAFLALGASQSDAMRNISDYYLHNSLPKGHGSNVVNVILTDFRALDTLGEITVLALAAVSISALLKLRPGPRKGLRSEKEAAQMDIRSDLLKISASYLKYILLVFSLFLLARGHHQPGGGFIAGLVAGSGIFFFIAAHGTEKTLALWYVRPHLHIGLGLFLCGVSAAAGLLQGDAIFESTTVTPAIAGGLAVTTPRLFDIGVFFTVIGSFLLIIICLMDEYQWK